MMSADSDFVIFGATPLARLIAGLLAERHGRRVALVGTSPSVHRLARGVDLSSTLLTRPETWALLARVGPESGKLVRRIAGRAALARVDPLFLATGEAGRAALGHVLHMATGFGRDAERVPGGVLGEGHEGLVLRDALLIERARAETGFMRWLEALGVPVLDPARLKTVRFSEGGVTLEGPDGATAAPVAILADDEAIAATLPPAVLGPALVPLPFTSLLTEPTRPLPARVVIGADSGVMLVQSRARAVSAIAPGPTSRAVPEIGALLARHAHMRRAGQIGFPGFASADGGPLAGRPRARMPIVLSGFGPVGAFLAPALARWLAGDADPEEAAWFEARGFGRPLADSPVAEFAPSLEGVGS